MSTNVLISGEEFFLIYGLEAITKVVLGKSLIVDLVTNPEELNKNLINKTYDLLISSTSIKDEDGLSILERFKCLQPNIKVLFVSKLSNPILIKRYIDAGANGYICINAKEHEFKKAILDVSRGEKYIPVFMENFEDSREGDLKLNDNPFNQLSKKEFVVLMLLLKGIGTKDIAITLNLKISTASTYKNRIFTKLKVSNLVELFNLAMEYNLIQDNTETPNN